ncbi:MAG: hypothetical protein ACFFCM_10185, partial [Promethearchaeota archaeon]
MKKEENRFQIWTKPSCASCILNIGYTAIMKSTSDKKLQYECMKKTYKMLETFSKDVFPTELSIKIFRM